MAETLPEQLHAPSREIATRDSNTELDATDVRLPQLKFAQYMSRVVTDELVPYGAIYVVQGQEDMEPVVLAKPAKAKGELGEAVRFYVLGFRKGFSYQNQEDDLAISPDGSYPNLALVLNQDPRNVRRTYTYTVVLPEAPELPAQFLMHGKWGGQAAKQLNTRLLLAKQKGQDTAHVPFKLQAKKTEAEKGPFAGAVIGLDKVAARTLKAELEVVDSLRDLLSSPSTNVVDEDIEPEAESSVSAPDLS